MPLAAKRKIVGSSGNPKVWRACARGAGLKIAVSTPLGITRASIIAGAKIDCFTLSINHCDGVAI